MLTMLAFASKFTSFTPTNREDPMLYRLGLAIARHARAVLIVAGIIMLGAIIMGSTAFGKLSAGGFADPGADSTIAADIMTEHFGAAPNLTMVLTAADGLITDAAAQEQATEVVSKLAAEPGVTVAESYFATQSEDLLALDGRSAMVTALVAGGESEMMRRGGELIDRYGGDHGAVTVRFGGDAGLFGDLNSEVSSSLIVAEAIAIPITLLLLLLVFGSAVAAALPLAIGAVAIIGTFAQLSIMGSFTDVSVFAINLTTALGLGLGIDYGLLIVARFREQIAAGDDVHHAVAHTVATAGRTIVFSAAAIGSALATLLVFPMFFLSSFGYAGIGVVAIAAAAGVVITPAMLALLGHRVNAGKMPWRGTATGTASALWHRVASTVFRRPVITAVPVLAILLLAASPLLGIHFSLPDQNVLSESSQSRQVADLVAEEFPAQSHAVIPVVLAAPADAATARSYAAELSRQPGVTSVLSERSVSVNGVALPAPRSHLTLEADGWQRIIVLTDVPAGSGEARDIAGDLRDVPVSGGPGFLVTGTDAVLGDTLAAIGKGLPYCLMIIALTTFVLLFLFTGSVTQPLRALFVNGLSLAAATGIVTWIFQDGHLISLFGATPRPMDASMTVLMLCVTFGLSMDYEVFLSSRITEMFHNGEPLPDAVADGTARTGTIVTSAALLLSVSFFAFTTSSVSMLQMLGLGAGLAVLIDATLIRGVLVPAAMRLLGRSNFWAPRPLRRVYERIGLAD